MNVWEQKKCGVAHVNGGPYSEVTRFLDELGEAEHEDEQRAHESHVYVHLTRKLVTLEPVVDERER